MQVAVIAKDALIADGLVSILAHEGQLPTAGAARNVSQASRMLGSAGVLAVVADGLEVDDWIQLGKVQGDGTIRVVLIATNNDEDSGKSAADVVIHSRDGSSAVVNAVKQLLGDPSPLAASVASSPMFVREAAPISYGRRGRGLTRREKDVASYVALGMSNRRISEVLQLQEQSVKNLVSSIMRKLDCENRVQIALKLTGKATPSGE